MPESVGQVSARSDTASRYDIDDQDDQDSFAHLQRSRTTPVSPTTPKRFGSSRTSDLDLRSRLPSRLTLDEHSGLLAYADGTDGRLSGYRTVPTSAPGTPGPRFTRQTSYTRSLKRNHSRHGSLGARLARAFGTEASVIEESDLTASRGSLLFDDRVWYDQFTSTDWVHDSIADAYRVKELRSRKDWRGRVSSLFDGAQGWILVAIIGCVTAGFAYVIDMSEAALFDMKTGYCSTSWWLSKRLCCSGASVCDDWQRWSVLMGHTHMENLWNDFAAYVLWTLLLSVLACLVTLQTRTTISSAISLSTLDENLAADHHRSQSDHGDRKDSDNFDPTRRFEKAAHRPPVIYYPAAGSGVAEVKVILSGFVLHGYLGVRTLVAKTLGLILAVSSGLSLGKEGPYVHIATCIGNIACRLFSKYNHNDGKRREVLSASAASGVAVAFGAPIGGVLFSLEEVSYYFPPKTLFRTFFCCIAAALSLKFLNPYGTGKIVFFEVRYLTDWKLFEMIAFAFLGVLGGATGALFIKASRLWAKTFRKIGIIKKYPMVEVVLVALVTGIVGFWNRYTRLNVAELLFELSSPCNAFSETGTGLCPTKENIPNVIWYLCAAFVIKAILTTITFGIKLPAGIYVPSMVVGGLLGRIVGHVVQLMTLTYPNFWMWSKYSVDGNPEGCVVPGVYALVAAGATMCGVTRLSVTLAVILFELTGSLEHVLPFSLGVLISKWTADAIEPLSIYDLLTDMNAYPYLDSKTRPVFTGDLGDITNAPNPNRSIDISTSPLMPARQLRCKLEYLHMAGEVDGGLPILRDGILVGLIPAPDLEFALDGLSSEDDCLCIMSSTASSNAANLDTVSGTFPVNTDLEHHHHPARFQEGPAPRNSRDGVSHDDLPYNVQNTDFTPYIDPAPVSLDITSPMDLVFECFVKLGLRYICVLREGKFVGLVHKKAFVRFVKEVREREVRG